MQPENFQALFKVSRETMEAMEIYRNLLLKWQKAINLVSPTTLPDLWLRHFADSAQLSRLIPQGAKIADLGSGAGFPGMVLSILRPDLGVALVESDERKAQFLKAVSRETGAKAVVYPDRVERVLGQINPDIVTARALASLGELLEFCLPLTAGKPDLRMLFLKGRRGQEECQEAAKTYRFSFEAIPSVTDQEALVFVIDALARRESA